MIIQKLNARQLAMYIESEAFRTGRVIPISRHRALSHINNPAVYEEDTIMLLAFIQEKLVGYLGILPGKISSGGAVHRIGWMSCLWVDAQERGKGIAKDLVTAAFESWDHNIVATEFTREAKTLYDKLNIFADLKVITGIRGYLRPNLHKVLPGKYTSLKAWRKGLKLTDDIFNLPNELRLTWWKYKSNFSSDQLEYVNSIDAETAEFISGINKEEFFKRDQLDLNWMFRYPWILNAAFEDHCSKRYQFSSLSKEFSYIGLKLYNKANVMKGFLILSVREKNMKIPYAYFEKDSVKDIVGAIYTYMLQMQVETLTVFNTSLCKYISENSSPFLLKKTMKRHYLISKKVRNILNTEKIVVQDGDGDCAFT